MHPFDLNRLARSRAFPVRDLSVAAALAPQFKIIQTRHRQFGKVGAAWSVALPDQFKSACELVTCTRGVLTVRAANSSIRFELDRWLRTGGLKALADAGGKVRSVKVVTE